MCPYHAWSYRHDGSLIGAPHFKEVEKFDKSTLGLKPVRVQEWHGWVFIDRSGSAEDFAAYIGELEQIVAPYDAELFGHWWFEGIEWLGLVLREKVADRHA